MKTLFRIVTFFLVAVLAYGATPQAIQRNPVTISPSNLFNYTGVVTNGAVANQKWGFDGSKVGWMNDLTAGTGATVWENGLAVNDPNFTNSPTALIESSGTNISVYPTNLGTAQLATDSVGADELNAGAVEAELEAVIDIADLQGAATDAQIPNNITIDLATLATTATTANAGDSATAFFSAGQIERARGGTAADTSAYGAGLFGSDAGNNTIDVDTEAELETALGAINVLVATEVSSLAQLDTLIGITGTPGSSNYWRGDNAWSRVALATDVTGNLAVTNLNGGTGASATTYWRGDATWVTPALQDLGGAVTDAQVPNDITIDLATLATTATTANSGDSATAFFSAGQIELARGGTGVDASGFGNGLFGMNSGSFVDVDSVTEFSTALGITGTPDGTKFLRDDFVWATPPGAGGGDSITVDGAATVDPNFDDGGDINFTYAAPTITATIKSGVVSADELDETGVESGLEAVLDLADLQGSVTDAQVPNTITIDLATVATTANAGDSATAFFSAGQIERARGGTGADTSAFGAGLFGSDGSNNTIDVDTIGELETALGSVNVIVSTEIDTIGELETLLGGVNVILATEIDTSGEFAGILGDESGTGAVAFTTKPFLTNAIEFANWTTLGTDVDPDAGATFYKLLTSNLTLTFSNFTDGQWARLFLENDTVGGFTITWPANTISLSHTNGPTTTMPGIDTNALAINRFVIFRRNGTNYVEGPFVRDNPLLTQFAGLGDPGADRFIFFDNSEKSIAYGTFGSGLSLTGTTLTASGSGSWDAIADAAADGTIALGAFETDFTSTLDSAGKAIWTITNTDAETAADTTFLEFRHNDGGDDNVIYLQFVGDIDGVPVTDLRFDQTVFRLGSAIALNASTANLNILTVTNSFAVLGTLSVGSLVVTNPVNNLYVTNLYLTNASPSQYVMTDSNRKLVTSATVNDDDVAFDDADSNYTATTIGAALEELDDVINGGVPNSATAKVDWSQLFNVPAGFADGTDDGAGGATAFNDIGDATGDGSITLGAHEMDFVSTIDAAGEAVWTITNTDADAANDNSFLDLRHNAGADANVFYARFIGDNDGTPSNDYLFSQTAMTVGSAITANFAGTLQEGGNAVFNSSETPGGELGGTWASPTIDDSVTVATWVMTGAPGLTLNNGGTGPGVLRINEDTDLGSSYAEFTVGDLTGNTVYRLPLDDGDAGEQLQTDGAGNLSWEPAGGAAATALNDIADSTGDGTINAGAHETLITAINDAADEAILTLYNASATAANNVTFLEMFHDVGGDANVFYARWWGDADGSATLDYAFSQTAMTVGAAITANFAGTLQEGGNAVFNSSETPGGELGGTWASPTIDDSVTVATWVMTGAPGLALNNGATGPGVLRINEDSDLGSSFLEFTVGDLSGNTIYRMPLDDGEPGEQLQTDGSGNLSWEAAGAGGATAWTDIGDATGDTTIDVGNNISTITAAIDQAGEFILTLRNTDTTQANDSYNLVLEHFDSTDANAVYLLARGNVDDTEIIHLRFDQTKFTLGSGIALNATTVNLNDLLVTNSFGVLGTLSVASLVVTNPVNNLYVTNLYLTNGTASRAVFTDSNRKLVTTGTSADLAGALSDEVGATGGFVRAEWTDEIFIPVTAMIDGSASPGPLRDFVDNNRKIKVRSFTNSTDNVVEFSWSPPSDITDGDTGTGDFQIKWKPEYLIETTAASSGQGATFGLAAISLGDNDDFGTTMGTEADSKIADLSTWANGDIVLSSPYTTVTFTGFAAGEKIQFSLRRDVGDTEDDYAQGVALSGVWLKFKRTVGTTY